MTARLMRIGHATSECFSVDPDQRNGFGTSDGSRKQESNFLECVDSGFGQSRLLASVDALRDGLIALIGRVARAP